MAGSHYVYVWKDAFGLPFYVGKGIGGRAKKISGRGKEFLEIYSKGGCEVEIVDSFIHESQAHALEVELIEKYGRKEECGTLVNRTYGGEGTTGHRHTDDAKERIRRAGFGRVFSEETKEKIRAANVGRKLSDQHKESLRQAQTGKRYSAEHREKLRAIQRSPERRDASVLARIASAPAPGGTSPYKGVSLHKPSQKWVAFVRINGKSRNLGYHTTEEEAARSYDTAAHAAWGDDCYLNFGPPAANDNKADTPCERVN